MYSWKEGEQAWFPDGQEGLATRTSWAAVSPVSEMRSGPADRPDVVCGDGAVTWCNDIRLELGRRSAGSEPKRL